MQKLNDLIPPDVEISSATATQILNRALQDANGWFDPLKDAARTFDFYQIKMKEIAKVGEELINESMKVGDITIDLSKAALSVLLPNKGDKVQFAVPEQWLAELFDEFGPITQMMIVNVGDGIDMMSVGEYTSVYGG